MADLIVPLGAQELEEVLAALEREFSAQGMPALLRLRAAMVTEELFEALRAQDDSSAKLSCAFPKPRTMELSYSGASGVLEPNMERLTKLFRAHCADGVTVAVRTGACTLAVRA